MRQTKLMSFVEATANVAVGFAVAVLTQIIVFPLFGLYPPIGDSLAIARSSPSCRSSDPMRCGGYSREPKLFESWGASMAPTQIQRERVSIAICGLPLTYFICAIANDTAKR